MKLSKINEKFEKPHGSPHQEKQKNSNTMNQDLSSEVTYKKSCILANYINNNLKSADFKWSLFCAACNSYRFDSVLIPFPPFFLLEEDKQINRLREVIKLCPPFITLIKELKKNNVNVTLLDLLYWVLIHLNEPAFKLISKEKHQQIISQVPSIMPTAMPDYVFSVMYGIRHQQKFSVIASNQIRKLAFHGSRLDNFYSIVINGLQVSFTKVAAFGQGIYLSSEIGVSLPYSPRGFTWSYSLFGTHISIVALCEFIDYPEFRSKNELKRNNKSNIFDIFNNQSIPGKYFIVKNSDFVCIKYLLVYSSDESKSASLIQSHTLLNWIKKHKVLIFVAAYIILLLGISSSNSSVMSKYYKRFIRLFDNFRS